MNTTYFLCLCLIISSKTHVFLLHRQLCVQCSSTSLNTCNSLLSAWKGFPNVVLTYSNNYFTLTAALIELNYKPKY